ncbi:MAG: response regulator transcription factor [Anaerolineales bacterium]
MVRILILEEHEMVRQALQERLDDAAGLEVVSSVGEYGRAVQEAQAVHPEVILMEIKTTAGLATLQALRSALPRAAVLVLTSYPDAREEEHVLALGARAYLLKTLNTASLVQAIHDTAHCPIESLRAL